MSKNINDKIHLKNVEMGEEKLFESIDDAHNFSNVNHQLKDTVINLPGKIWKVIPEYSDYQVSNLGRVRHGIYILNTTIPKGYKVVSIKNDNKEWKQVSIHRLVGMTFLSKDKYDKSVWDKLQINHIDGNKLNNNISNLEWCLPRENVLHAYKMKLNPINRPIYIEYEKFVYIFYTSTEVKDIIDDFIELTDRQLRSYINSEYLFKDKYFIFDDNYEPFISTIPNLPGEKWVRIDGLEGKYFISNKGRLKSLVRNRKDKLIQYRHIKQYVGMSMYQLMAKYFTNEEFKYVYIKDDNAKNFSLDNLMFNKIENLPGEEWKAVSTIWVKDEEVVNKIINMEYEISTKGRIRYIKDSRMFISYGHNKKKCIEFRIIYNRKEYSIPVCRLVMLTFFPIEQCKTYEDYSKYKVVFLDNNNRNNTLYNLTWINGNTYISPSNKYKNYKNLYVEYNSFIFIFGSYKEVIDTLSMLNLTIRQVNYYMNSNNAYKGFTFFNNNYIK